MNKVKLFRAVTQIELEKAINEFFGELYADDRPNCDRHLVDIKYQDSGECKNVFAYSALVIYWDSPLEGKV